MIIIMIFLIDTIKNGIKYDLSHPLENFKEKGSITPNLTFVVKSKNPAAKILRIE